MLFIFPGVREVIAVAFGRLRVVEATTWSRLLQDATALRSRLQAGAVAAIASACVRVRTGDAWLLATASNVRPPQAAGQAECDFVDSAVLTVHGRPGRSKRTNRS